MKFLTPGEKIKEIRKCLKMNQSDLQDRSITRGLISMIEIGKRDLTKMAAVKLIEKFNQRAKELNINLDIDENYLLSSASEDAEIYCLKKLENSNIDDNIDEILVIASEFNLCNVKIQFYIKRADNYLLQKEYDAAFTDYNEAIIICQNLKQYEMFPYLYWKIGFCKAAVTQYTDALAYFNNSRYYSLMYKQTKINQNVLYNEALCYKKLNKLDLAMECIENCLLLSNKKNNLYFYANILKANCYETLKNYDVAIEIYNNLKTEALKSDDPLLGYIYNNLGLVYFDKADYETSLEYFDKAEKIRSSTDKQNLSHTLVEKSKIYIELHQYSKAIQIINLALKYAEIYKDDDYLLKGNYSLICIYECLNDTANLKEIYIKIADLLKGKKNDSNEELMSVYIKLSLIYLSERDIENAEMYLTISQNLNT